MKDEKKNTCDIRVKYKIQIKTYDNNEKKYRIG